MDLIFIGAYFIICCLSLALTLGSLLFIGLAFKFGVENLRHGLLLAVMPAVTFLSWFGVYAYMPTISFNG